MEDIYSLNNWRLFLVNLFNYSKLYFGHLKNSKKVIFVSTIGLICAIAIISSSLLYVDSTKGEIADTLLNASNSNNNDFKNFDIHLDMSYRYPLENTNDITAEMNNITSNLMNQADLNIFTSLNMYYMIQELATPQNYYYEPNKTSFFYNGSVAVVQLNDVLKTDLQSFISSNSSLPLNNASVQQAFALESYFGTPTSAILNFYKNHNLLNLQNSTIIPVYDPYMKGNGYNFNISGTGKIIQTAKYVPQTNSYQTNLYNPNYPALSQVWNSLRGPNLILFVNNLTRYTSTFVPNEYNQYTHRISAEGGFNIDLSKVDPLAIASRTSDIVKFTKSLETKISNSNFYKQLSNYQFYMNIQFTTQSAYQNMENATTAILFNMLLYALPILIIALLTANYSFGLIHKKVINNIGVYKTRGASKYLMFFFELLDFLLVLVLSLVAGALAGIPIASLVTKTDFLLSFNNGTNYDIINTFITNLPSITETLFIFSIVVSAIVNLRRTFKLSTITIVETENIMEKADPYWKRHYVDAILFLYGFVSYMTLVYLISNQGQSINPLINLFMVLSLPSPFAMVLGAILMLNRLTPILLNWIGSKLWKHSGGLLAFSFKNVIRHHQASTRAIMLIASLLTFLLVFYSIPFSNVNYQQKTSLFDNGAEGILTINSFQRTNLTDIDQIITNMSNIIATNFSNSIVAYSAFFTATVNDNSGFGQERFLFINTTSYIQASTSNQFNIDLKSGSSLKNVLGLLHETNNSLLMNEAAFNDRLLSLNENVTFKSGNSQLQDFQIVDAYNIWPATTRYTWDSNAWVITDMNHLLNSTEKDLENTLFHSINSVGFYLNFKEGVNRTAVAQNLTLVTNNYAYASNYEPQNWDIYNSLIFRFQIGQINTNVIMSLIIGVIILIMFAYMQLNDRKREIYTELALGMKIRQTSVLFFVESIILLLSGIVVGSVLGFFFIQMLAIYMTQGTQIPSYDVLTPWMLVLETYLGFIILAILSAIIPAYYVTKQDISRSFITDA